MNPLTTLEYANSYFETKLKADAWSKADETTKNKLLIEATRRIYAIQGFKYTPEVVELLQAIPDDLQQACCEVALSLAQDLEGENPHITNQRLGIKSISFGNDSVSYGETKNSNGMNPIIFNEYAQALLNQYILKGFRYV